MQGKHPGTWRKYYYSIGRENSSGTQTQTYARTCEIIIYFIIEYSNGEIQCNRNNIITHSSTDGARVGKCYL